MFSAIQTGETILLQSGSSKVEIWPQCGGILNSWTVQMHDRAWNIVDGYDSPADFRVNCEAKGFRSAKLSPYVCRLNKSQYNFEGVHYTIGKFELAGNAIHGLLYNNVFTIENSFSDDQAAVVILQHDYDGSDAGYPFTYTIRVTYILRANNELGVNTTVTNTNAAPIPIADGWHPYFSLGEKINNLAFSMQTGSLVVFDECLIPTGELEEYKAFHKPTLLSETFFDHCFLLQKPLQGAACILTNQKEKIQLEIFPDTSYPYLQVYTPPHRNSIAFENLSAAPDAFNNHMGLIILDAGETHTFSTSFKVAATT
ncbi:MAG: aldose 1-epimerase [Bacteroidota bacterium]